MHAEEYARKNNLALWKMDIPVAAWGGGRKGKNL
jgi:hypothetical protein